MFLSSQRQREVVLGLPQVSGDQWRLVGGAIGGQSDCNSWNGINGLESNVFSICLMCLLPFHLFHFGHYNEPIAPPTSLHWWRHIRWTQTDKKQILVSDESQWRCCPEKTHSEYLMSCPHTALFTERGLEQAHTHISNFIIYQMQLSRATYSSEYHHLHAGPPWELNP